MSTKSALKAAKAAIDSKNWEEAVDQANIVLDKDPNNYFAKLFLGRANDGLSKYDDAAKAYNDATGIKPDDPQAWLGLRGMYEGLGGRNVGENIDVGLRLAEIYANMYEITLDRCMPKLIVPATTPIVANLPLTS